MAQSALTVTPPNPTPPTNMSCTGATPPNPPNYTKLTYADYLPDTDFDTNPPPYFDDGSAGSLILFAANTSALASGSGATAGGTEGSYPGAAAGAVPASTSVAHEAAGTETSSTWGSAAWPTNPNTLNPSGVPVMVGVGPALTAASIAAGPNASHASTLSPATNPTLTSVANATSGGGTTTCTATGTNFTRQSVLNVNGINYTTTYTSATTISCTAPRKATPGTLPVYVITGGVVQTAPVNWTFT